MKKNLTFLIAAPVVLLRLFAQPIMGWGQTTVTQTSFSAISGNVNNDTKVSYYSYRGGGTANPGVYDNAIRLYQNSSSTTGGYIVIGVDNGYVITSATIQSTSGTTTGYKLTSTNPGSTTPEKNTFNENNYSLSANTDYTVNNISTQYIVFACFGNSSSTRLNLSKISITYQSNNPGTPTYTVTYNANGGTGTVIDNHNYHLNDEVTVLGASGMSRTGHTFDHWDTQADDEGTDYAVGDIFNITENMTLYAQWTVNSHNFTLTVEGEDVGASAQLNVDNTVVITGTKIAYGKEVTIDVIVNTGYIYTVTVNDGGITVNDNKFTMPDEDVTVLVTTEEYPFLTTSLTSSDMQSMTGSSGYGNVKTKTTDDGFTWITDGYQTAPNSTSSVYGMIQLNSNYNIILPEFNGKIETISFSVTDASSTASNGGVFKGKLHFKCDDDPTVDVSGGNTGSGTNSITLDVSSGFYSTGKITTTTKPVRIWNIEVKYKPYKNMTGTTLTSIEDDKAIAIPVNIAATATDLTIPTSSGIIIRSGASLTVSGTLTNTGNQRLIIEEGGQLIANNTAAGTIKKSITGYGTDNDGYYFIASPVDHLAPTTAMTTGSFDLYYFDGSEALPWINYKTGENTIDENFRLYTGKGYLYANSADTELKFAGTLTATTESLALDNSGTETFQGWNLIGNPYPCNVTINVPFYRMDTEGSGLAAQTTTLETTAIKPMEGVFVKYATGVTSVTFTKAPNVSSSGSRGTINLSLSNHGKQTDNAIVRFDGGNNLEKVSFHEDNAMLYIQQSGMDYAVVTAEAQGEMPVYFKATTDDTYTISVNAENLEVGYLHLIDNFTGVNIDLLQTPSYTFEGHHIDYASRFKLVFNANNTNGNDNNFAFVSGDHLVILNNGNATLQVIDMLGRIIDTQTINNNANVNIKAKGIYILRLINGEKVKNQKIVVK